MAETVLVVDCETTGLTLPSAADLSKQPRIIELGCALLQDGALLSEHCWVLHPGVAISDEIVKITGITNAMLEGKPSFKEALPEIKALFAQAAMLVAHNAAFDTDCLRYELLRCGCEDFPWPAETFCTVQEYVHEFGHRPKLTELYENKVGRPLKQEHRALSDVRALVEILMKEGLA